MKTPSILATLCLIAFAVLSAQSVFAATDYLLVKDLPLVGDTSDPVQYLNNIFKLALGLAATLAVLMTVVYGVQYMLSDVPAAKIQSRNGMKDALTGFILIAASVLILNTVNPDLTSLKFFDRLKTIQPAAGTGGATTTASCTNCVELPATLKARLATGCAGFVCKLDGAFIPRVEGLAANLAAQGIGWAITEAWPPIYKHEDSCHSSGRCIDANFRGTSANAENILKFQTAASSAGLRATYEVKTQAEFDALKAAGVSLLMLNPKASNSHFHID